MLCAADITEIVKNKCEQLDIDYKLILAIIKVESNFNPNAIKYERSFIYYYRAEEFAKTQGITRDTETCLQKFSWGLLQLMGASARWVGYTGFLPDLCNAEINIIWGCEFFKKTCGKYVYLTDQISAYNAGSVKKDASGKYANQDYVDEVLEAMEELEKAEGSNLHVN